ncbi:hypothetical protein TVAG_237040 [Trichomonas vaginalis G3]|uniref:Uncharacterized protein n=1 Tax=Trichomonas vaginalis (strain ATCC PRA-98 / G3) TaxID=412133 RepID=A2DCQ4_TRIV3|nr:hypothetical protein TVAGG3_0607330 [Trichomonas vaginalis G3]EAY21678.1 hypothetical protein TVAG_237040 [Trichomonas vaginalis G3]KAI5524343.1 hypothetical protein TVAGG3_0607330 [Trichomonas vaginalis G3]|eukprot:XP_001582664.1 hypothetical protein [Trichomonas vaginalis G3]
MKKGADFSDSDFDADELLADLGPVGAALKSTAKKTDNKEKPKPKPKKSDSKNDDKPKRRPVTRMKMNLDDLLDGISPNAAPIPTVSSFTPVVQNSATVEQIESRLNSYLAMQLRTLVNEFSVEVGKMFDGTDGIDEIIQKFTNDIRASIRDACNFDLKNENNLPTASSLFDLFGIGFAETFKDANSFKSYQPAEEIKRVKAIRGKIVPLPSMIKATYTSSLNEMTQALTDREMYQSQLPVTDKELSTRLNNLSLKRYELECKSEMLNSEAEKIAEQFKKLDETRSQFSTVIEENSIKIEEDINSLLHRKISGIKSLLSKAKKTPSTVQLYKSSDFQSVTEEMSTMIDAHEYNIQNLIIACEGMRNAATVASSTEVAPPVQSTAVAITHEIPQVSTSTSTNDLLNRVRKQLSQVQKMRETELQNANTMLATLKRQEKRRRRQQRQQEILYQPDSPSFV